MRVREGKRMEGKIRMVFVRRERLCVAKAEGPKLQADLQRG